MPKQDRCADIKKDSAKAKKRAQADSQREAQRAEPEAEEPAAAAAPPARRGAPAQASTFARAGRLSCDAESDEEPAAAPAPRASAGEAERPAARKKRQQATNGSSDMDLLMEGERAARRQRIIDRFLRLVLVGVLLEARKGQGDGQRDAKETKGKKKGPSSGARASSAADQAWNMRSIFQKVDIFGGPFLMLAFTVAMLAARLMEEGYTPDHRQDNEANYYEVLGITSDADVLDIRKAYKALALSWHPDKNPNCEACPSRFAKISEAYETLNSPENRKAYDSRKARKGSLSSMASTELTAEDFEARVLRSNEVWIVQIYDPNDGGCRDFHPVWEDVALSHQHIAKFGRIDATKNKRALDFLPMRVVLMPLVFRFARGDAPESLLWSGEDQGPGTLSRFIMDGYPAVPRLESKAELKSFWAPGAPHILVAGPAPAPRRGLKALENLQVPRMAHVWTEFADFALTDPKLAKSVLGQDFQPEDGDTWSFTSRTSSGAVAGTKSVNDIKDVPAALQEVVTAMVRSQVPSITVRNHQQLCGASSLGNEMRTFCLVLVDVSDSSIAGVLNDLNASQTTYGQEVQDLRSSGEESEEPPFHIQPVRLTTRSSRWPWGTAAAGPGFRELWGAAKRAPVFVLELETQRLAPVKLANLRDLYQNIAYEDLKFQELPEGFSLPRALPDPETPLRREFSALLSSPLSALALFLLAAAVAAVLPELSVPAACGALGGAAALLLAAWPWAFRRFFAVFWCTAFAGNYECQVNL